MTVRIQIVTEKWNPISAVIRYTTRSWASHAEFVFADYTNEVKTLGARSAGGVKVRLSRRDHYTQIEHFVLNTPQSESVLKNAFQWAYDQTGKPYDYSAIMGIAADRNWHDESRWFCSELVAVACEKAGFPILSTRPSDASWRVTPRDLLLSRGLVFIEASTFKFRETEEPHGKAYLVT